MRSVRGGEGMTRLDFTERVDELLGLQRYRLTTMALKAVLWELQRIYG